MTLRMDISLGEPEKVTPCTFFIKEAVDPDTDLLHVTLGFKKPNGAIDYVVLNATETLKVRDELIRIAEWQTQQFVHRPKKLTDLIEKEGEE